MIREMYKSNPGVQFLLRLVFAYVLWRGFYFVIWHNPMLTMIYKENVQFVIHHILHFSNGFLLQLGEVGYVDQSTDLLRIPGSGGVIVGEPCVGFDLMYMFAALIFSFPVATFWRKILPVVLGLAMIHFLNIARVGGLAFLSKYAPEWLDFNHVLGFKSVVYAFIFLYWVHWLRLAQKSEHRRSKQMENISSELQIA